MTGSEAEIDSKFHRIDHTKFGVEIYRAGLKSRSSAGLQVAPKLPPKIGSAMGAIELGPLARLSYKWDCSGDTVSTSVTVHFREITN